MKLQILSKPEKKTPFSLISKGLLKKSAEQIAVAEATLEHST